MGDPDDPVYVGPAAEYAAAGDLAVLSCFFNSEDFQSKRWALEEFCAAMRRSPLHLFMAEVAFGDRPFALPEDIRTLGIRGGDVIWQKERLLNLLLASVPARFGKIAWLDADLLFENAAWAQDASTLLEHQSVVQLYSHCYRLRPGERAYRGQGERALSFGSVRHALPLFARFGDHGLHGHTGYAWAARRQVLDTAGFYDGAITGSGDDLMAHGFAGDFAAPCLRKTFAGNTAYLEHYRRWAVRAFDTTGGKLAYVDGAVLHLWHGELKRRGYPDGNRRLNAAGYDPVRHLALDSNGLWCWTDAAGEVRESCRELFASRREDDAG